MRQLGIQIRRLERTTGRDGVYNLMLILILHIYCSLCEDVSFLIAQHTRFVSWHW